MIRLYCDAARQQHSGVSTAGAIVIVNKQQQQFKTTLGLLPDNHAAEFAALLWILQQLSLQDAMLTIYVDSKIVADSLNKQYAKHYQAYVDDIWLILNQVKFVSIEWISEKENLGAHHLALQMLHQKNKS